MIVLKAKLTEKRPLDVARDPWREITRGAYRAVGQYWVDNYLKGHFTPEATAKYGYKFRQYWIDRRWKRRELKELGKNQFQLTRTPLVHSGYMREEILRSIVIRGFPTRTTVIMYGPKYLSTRFHKKRQPDKPAEITRVIESERKQLARVLEQEIVNRLNAYRGQRVTE